ncbi:MAG: nucleotide sugar dehydrogenase, partial [Planctomycetota bacterium]
MLKKIAKVAVIGLGYVGLPLARAVIQGGLTCIGLDIDKSKIQKLRHGQTYLRSVTSSEIQEWLSQNLFYPTTDFSSIQEAEAILIAVPTPLTRHRDPDLTYIINTAHSILPHLVPHQLVVLESTTYPGTTEEVLKPILEKSGFRDGENLYIAYSPEREDPGNPKFTTSNIPKVVGADHPKSLERAKELYSQIITEIIPMNSTKEAEGVKILENIYRAVNIALVNELKILFDKMGLNIWNIIEAAATKPFGFQKFLPGPGLGGHCIPIDPFYLSWKAKEYDLSTQFIELAGLINSSMPSFVVSKIQDGLSQHGKAVKGARILIVGMAYKKDVEDLRESPALKIISLLQEKGAHVMYHDPYIQTLPKLRHYPHLSIERVELEKDLLKSLDCAVIVTDHTKVDYEFLVRHAPLIVDTRNATKNLRQYS